MSNYLMVPVRLDALYVQGEELTVVNQNVNFSILPFLDRVAKAEINSETANISEAVVSLPFQNENLRLGHGIHLHWALPDALTRGDSGLNFPPVPNRWLVTRRKKDGNNWPISKQWVVESDYLYPPGVNKRGVSVSIPFFSLNWKIRAGTATEYDYVPSGYQYDKSYLPSALQGNTNLLQRFFTNPDAEMLTLKEVEDSDQETDPYAGITISAEEKQQFEQFLRHPLNRADQPFRFMGRKMPASAWREDFDGTEYYPNLTAVGYGDPTFAAFYPNCFSVFGLHDDLADLRNVDVRNVRYEIAGWYSEESYKDKDHVKDPLAKFVQSKTEVTISDIIEKFNWKIADQESAIPDRMLCYAGLSFSENYKADDHPNRVKADVSITVANTPTEALSACLAEKLVDQSDSQRDARLQTVEDQLEAMQLAYRLDQKKLDTVTRFDRLRHENGFTPVDSGHLWVIRKESKPAHPEATGLSPLQASVPDTVEEDAITERPEFAFIAGDLDAVNRLQREYDEAHHAIETMRRQLFADWYKYMICVYPPESVVHDYPDPDLVKFFIETSSLAPLQKKIRATGTLNALQTQSTSTDSNNAVQPRPVEAGNITSISASQDSDPSSVAARLAEQINALIQHIENAEDIINTENRFSFELTQEILEDLEKMGIPSIRNLGDLVNRKFTRQKTFVHEVAERIGQEATATHQSEILERTRKEKLNYTNLNFYLEQIPAPRFWQPTNPVVLIEGDVVTPTKRHGQDDLLSCQLFDSGAPPLSDSGFKGITQKIHDLSQSASEFFGFNIWEYQPWNPFLLEWQTQLYPIAGAGNLDQHKGAYRQSFITDNYQAAPLNPDLSVKSGKGKILNTGHIYTGESILSPQAVSLLKNAIEEELITRQKIFETAADISVDKCPGAKNFENPVYTMIRAYAELQNLKTLSQSLNGFHKALLMHKQTMELAIEDPLGFEAYRSFTDQQVRDAMSQSIKIAPSPLNVFNPIRSGCLKMLRLCLVDTFGQTRELSTDKIDTTYLMTTPSSPYLVQMPPRLAQPARLNFRWLDAEEGARETNSHTATTPICGWLLTNRLDQSLMFYDANGKALGYFQAGRWQEAIDSDKAREIKDIRNPHLRKVAGYVRDSLTKDAKFLEHFIGTIDDALDKIHPEKDTGLQSLALLMGHPVAVVRAALNLELCGPPAVNQDWNIFRRDFTRQIRTDDNFPQVKFPVRLGEYGQLNDSLVGYWLENTVSEVNCIRLTANTLAVLKTRLKNMNLFTEDILNGIMDELSTKHNRIYTNPSDFLSELKQIVAHVSLRTFLSEITQYFSKTNIAAILKNLKTYHLNIPFSLNMFTDPSVHQSLRDLVEDIEGGHFDRLEQELSRLLEWAESLRKGKDEYAEMLGHEIDRYVQSFTNEIMTCAEEFNNVITNYDTFFKKGLEEHRALLQKTRKIIQGISISIKASADMKARGLLEEIISTTIEGGKEIAKEVRKEALPSLPEIPDMEKTIAAVALLLKGHLEPLPALLTSLSDSIAKDAEMFWAQGKEVLDEATALANKRFDALTSPLQTRGRAISDDIQPVTEAEKHVGQNLNVIVSRKAKWLMAQKKSALEGGKIGTSRLQDLISTVPFDKMIAVLEERDIGTSGLRDLRSPVPFNKMIAVLPDATKTLITEATMSALNQIDAVMSKLPSLTEESSPLVQTLELKQREAMKAMNTVTEQLRTQVDGLFKALPPFDMIKSPVVTMLRALRDPNLIPMEELQKISLSIFYAPQSDYIDSAGIESRFEYFEDGSINFAQSIADPPQTITMLMDVQGSIYVTVGILPGKEITIPPEQYARALKNIEVTFLHAPILTRQTKIELPLRPVHGYAWSWVEWQKQQNQWNELFPENRIEQEVFVQQWNIISKEVPGETLWEYLFRPDVNWLAPVDDNKDGTPDLGRGKVVNKAERRAAVFAPFVVNSIVYDVHGQEEQVEAILDLYSTGIDPVVTDAVFAGQQEIREGWLKLRKVETQN